MNMGDKKEKKILVRCPNCTHGVVRVKTALGTHLDRECKVCKGEGATREPVRQQ